jgi:hypothetical protein
VITGVALCPSPPLLHPAVTGQQAVLPELRLACADAIGWLLGTDPEVVVVVGPAAATGRWDAASRLDPSAFAPAIARSPAVSPDSPALPLSLGLGAMLLDDSGYRGPRELRAIGLDEPPGRCAALGAELGASGARTAWLVMGDGSACRTAKAPGYLDPRAAAFDAEVENIVRAGELAALQRLDRQLARELLVTGLPAWQVLSGATSSVRLRAAVRYCDAPLGVAYLVARLRPDGPGVRPSA